MPIVLKGRCFVSELREGDPVSGDGWREWPLIDRARGATAISLRVLELSGGRAVGWTNTAFEEVVYVMQGRGIALVEGHGYPIGPDDGVHFPRDVRVGLRADADTGSELLVVGSRCPEPPGAMEVEEPLTSPAGSRGRTPVVALRDQVQQTTGDRWYCELIDSRRGSTVTQFVGAIPPGRAPDHYHDYEEVLCVLRGEGRLWAEEQSAPIGPGSCIYLPRRQIHSVENTGSAELRLLGVFYPAGSPAVRYTPGSGVVTSDS